MSKITTKTIISDKIEEIEEKTLYNSNFYIKDYQRGYQLNEHFHKKYCRVMVLVWASFRYRYLILTILSLIFAAHLLIPNFTKEKTNVEFEKIAMEWDKIEQSLHDNDFWYITNSTLN